MLGGNVAALLGGQATIRDQLVYAPTYYPGVGSVAEARAVAVGVSQEVNDVDFGLQLVRAPEVSGHVENPDGSWAATGNVNLMPQGAAAERGGLGTMFAVASAGTAVQHQQRTARRLHAAGAQQRPRRAAVGLAAALGRRAATSATWS